MYSIFIIFTLFFTLELFGTPPLSLEKIGYKIWENECGCKKYENILFWNQKEPFPSLGIAHFIWLPENVDVPFVESFPEFIQFAAKSGRNPPKWVLSLKNAPWVSRDEFLNDLSSPRMEELKTWLLSTVDLQASFCAHRLDGAIKKILSSLKSTPKEHVEKIYTSLSLTEAGLFAMIDYLNFKGDGLSPKERYQGKGWGLTQVLLGTKEGNIESFKKSAKNVLEERVQLAPKEESHFLKGWLARVERY